MNYDDLSIIKTLIDIFQRLVFVNISN